MEDSSNRSSLGQSTTSPDQDDVEAVLCPHELLREVALLRREVEELRTFREIAYRDALTGLRNRRYFDVRIKEELSRVSRTKAGNEFSVIMIDLDGLKTINDGHGHARGDETLRWAGTFLESKLRQVDVCCRLGGDEFVLLLPDADRAGATQLADRIRVDLAAENEVLALAVQMSLGVATWLEDGDTIEALLEKADASMYEEKRGKREQANRGQESRLRPTEMVRGVLNRVREKGRGPSTRHHDATARAATGARRPRIARVLRSLTASGLLLLDR